MFMTKHITKPIRAIHFLVLAFLMMIGSQVSAADDFLLRCTLSNKTVRHYLVSPSQKTVKRVGVKKHPICTLSTTDISYYWECKETKTYSASIGRVYRYTGKFEFEWGSPPFEQNSLDNWFFEGTCEREKAEQKF